MRPRVRSYGEVKRRGHAKATPAPPESPGAPENALQRIPACEPERDESGEPSRVSVYLNADDLVVIDLENGSGLAFNPEEARKLAASLIHYSIIADLEKRHRKIQ